MNCSALLLILSLGAGLIGAPDSATEQAAKRFGTHDRDGNNKLSLQEFLAAKTAKAPVAKRDFHLFDWNEDGLLSIDEYLALPTVLPPEHRGPIPDPMLALLDQAVLAMDQSFDNWDRKPETMVDANQFIAAFINTLGSGTPRMSNSEADADGNRRVSRDEARRFLEIQLGLRLPGGRLLREPNGICYNVHLFDHLDENRNSRISRAEFVKRLTANEDKEALFDQANSNGDNALTFDEFATLKWRGWLDNLGEFRKLDKDLDGKVDRTELLAGLPEWKRHAYVDVFPAFDSDGDGTLSLSEYLTTMPANYLLSWHAIPKDKDGDRMLTVADFDFGSRRFPLLRFVYFKRLDRNGDNKLDHDEYTFRDYPQQVFYKMRRDGTDWQKLFAFEGYPAVGSPAVSPDGKQLAFDAHKPRSSTWMFVMPLDASKPPRAIARGMMPTWSNDGRKISFSNSGVGTMDLLGNNASTFERGGWGAQWSPDGKRIAFTHGAAVKTYDVESGEIKTVLEKDAHSFRQIYWNMTWSPSSDRLCFKAVTNDGEQQVAVIDAAGNSKPKVYYSAKTGIFADFAWHPDGGRIVFGAHCPERKLTQLYEFDPVSDDPPILVDGQDETRRNLSACWTPDGEWLILVSADPW